MSNDKVTCSDLDNTVHSSAKQDAVKNSNITLADDGSLLREANTYIKQGDVDVCYSQEVEHSVDGEDNDIDEYNVDVMTGSYGEISLEQELLAAKCDEFPGSKDSQSSKTTEDEEDTDKKPSPEENATSPKENRRPNSLVLTKNSGDNDKAEAAKFPEAPECPEPWKKIHKSQQTSDSQTTSVNDSPSFSSEEFAICSPRHQRTGSDTSGLTDLQGTITVDGDIVSFVAEDLQEKIRLSSPVSRWTDSPSYPGSRSSTPSLYRQALQPHVPVIDAGAIADLEAHAKRVATCVDTMLGNLSGTLQSISSLTVDYMETYEKAVCKTCDAVDTSIKTMYQLMAKCEELSNAMKPLYKLSQDIKDMKKVLEHFEYVVEHKS